MDGLGMVYVGYFIFKWIFGSKVILVLIWMEMGCKLVVCFMELDVLLIFGNVVFVKKYFLVSV